MFHVSQVWSLYEWWPLPIGKACPGLQTSCQYMARWSLLGFFSFKKKNVPIWVVIYILQELYFFLHNFSFSRFFFKTCLFLIKKMNTKILLKATRFKITLSYFIFFKILLGPQVQTFNILTLIFRKNFIHSFSILFCFCFVF